MSVTLCQGGAGDTPMFPEDRSLLLSHLHIPPNASFWFPDGALAEGEGEVSTGPSPKRKPCCSRGLIFLPLLVIFKSLCAGGRCSTHSGPRGKRRCCARTSGRASLLWVPPEMERIDRQRRTSHVGESALGFCHQLLTACTSSKFHVVVSGAPVQSNEYEWGTDEAHLRAGNCPRGVGAEA